LAAIPKSIIHTSPALTAGIVFLQAVEHHRAFQRRLIAERNIVILGRQFEQTLANRSQLSLGQLGKFIYDVRRTHAEKLTRIAGLVMQIHSLRRLGSWTRFCIFHTKFPGGFGRGIIGMGMETKSLGSIPLPDTPQPIILWPNFHLNSSKKSTWTAYDPPQKRTRLWVAAPFSTAESVKSEDWHEWRLVKA
jgi:hypothetical protein